MRDFARRSAKDRRDLFTATSQLMHVHEAIIEKDFWVCWVPDYLFHESPWKDKLIFKGGTSLSKAYRAIERFSEDIDLILDWKLLGYAADEPWEDRSSTQQDIFGKEANSRTAEYLMQTFAPAMATDLKNRLGTEIEIWTEDQSVIIGYPRAFSLESIRPRIILEIGPLAESVPNEQRDICPFAAEKFPRLLTRGNTLVKTVVAERTFWEKATILHQEAHRGDDKPLPARYSRHYYDLYRLSRLPIKTSALNEIGLLNQVVRFKMKFYRCPWAKFEEARPGSLILQPALYHITELRKDYDSMKSMLFGAVPAFNEIINGLKNLEIEINTL